MTDDDARRFRERMKSSATNFAAGVWASRSLHCHGCGELGVWGLARVDNVFQWFCWECIHGVIAIDHARRQRQ